jgi:hypothetical protein
LRDEDTGLAGWIIEHPWHTVYVDRRSSNARRVFADLPDFRFTDQPERADLLWIRKGYTDLFPVLADGQLLNHFVDEGCMINKARLTTALAREDAPFYPESYRLSSPADRAAFLDQLPAHDDPDNLWIFKPGGLSRGKGIRILWQFDELRKQLAGRASSDPVLDESLDYVAQRYIKRPLLLDGRKSEVRFYWLIASVDPLLVLIYPEGTVRLTNTPYVLGDYDNPLVHVTNTYQQKQHPQYDPTRELKWTFSELDAYLLGQRQVKRYTSEILRPAVAEALAGVVRAVRSDLVDQSTRAICFGQFGVDIIIDDQLRPWLAEIQKSPGLSHVGDRVKIGVIPPMLQEAVRIALEVRACKRDGKPLGNIEAVDRFEWIINEA